MLLKLLYCAVDAEPFRSQFVKFAITVLLVCLETLAKVLDGPQGLFTFRLRTIKSFVEVLQPLAKAGELLPNVRYLRLSLCNLVLKAHGVRFSSRDIKVSFLSVPFDLEFQINSFPLNVL